MKVCLQCKTKFQTANLDNIDISFKPLETGIPENIFATKNIPYILEVKNIKQIQLLSKKNAKINMKYNNNILEFSCNDIGTYEVKLEIELTSGKKYEKDISLIAVETVHSKNSEVISDDESNFEIES